MTIKELHLITDLIDILCEAEASVNKEDRRVFTFSEGDVERLHEIQEEFRMIIGQLAAQAK